MAGDVDFDSIDPVLVGRLLSRALDRGGDYADLYFQARRSTSFSFEDGRLRTATCGVSIGLGVRVQRGDATGYAYTEALDDEAMMAAATTAGRIAASTSTSPAPPRALTPPNRYAQEHRTTDAPSEEKRSLLARADRAARAFDARVTRVTASLTEEDKEILVASSDGTFVRDRQPLLRFGVHVIAEDPKTHTRQAGSSGGGGRVALDYFLLPGRTPEHQAREAARIATVMLDAKEAPAGELPVVLGAGDSGILLHEAVGHGLEADFNRKRTSNYTDRIGQMVASELVTVVDDPTFAQGRGTINIDDEGVIAKPARLIDRGRLVGYLQDRQTARFFGTESGRGRRESFRCAPMPRMTNTVMLHGPHSAEEIIESVKFGVYAKRFSGGQVNISNGDFVFSLTESYLIEDGKITAPIRGVNLIGNGPEVLAKVDMLAADVEVSDGIWTCGKEGQSVPVGVGCPTTRISAITVGGTKVS
ncbi:MAG: metalloprotease TldD [Deltaproteobacteria bacterium]|nr:metalloprotease TldD [Deltaproteobacteria bacterium]